jgi:2-polyprenyl-3-methyl-5-hydroxy-6-metoxy-1,4-benzoquinol methylase
MGNELKGLPAHSSEYFGDTREHWWHDDFVAMVAARWRAPEIKTVLDVGCGVGHWGRVLARVLPPDAVLTGIDREALWVEKAAERAAAAGLSGRASYRRGTAEALPFDAGTFDLVTCQTLLMHVRDPAAVLGEMVRVTRPGGLVLVAEATNLAGPLLQSIAVGNSPETTASLMQFQLVCERGKKILGEGDNQIGEALPRLLHDAGLKSVEIRQNDRPSPLLPRYEAPPQRAEVEELFDGVARSLWIWDEATTRRYFLAGGGGADAFRDCWTAALEQGRRIADAVRAKTYSLAGGGLFYLAWGRHEAVQEGSPA